MRILFTLFPYLIIGVIFYYFLKRNGLFSKSENTNRTYEGVMSHQEIKHKNRLGGLVRNPVTNELEPYNINHPLWYEE